MKKIIALICIFVLSISCIKESNNPRVYFDLLPVHSVVLPTSFTANTSNEIEVKYLKPTSCHGFNGFNYTKDANTRTIAIQNYILDEGGCLPLTNQMVTQILNFKPTEVGTYLLKFWKGKDANGVNIYEEYSVVVQ
jgi:hypothetical protein